MINVDWSIAPLGVTHYQPETEIWRAHWIKNRGIRQFICIEGREKIGWKENHMKYSDNPIKKPDNTQLP